MIFQATRRERLQLAREIEKKALESVCCALKEILGERGKRVVFYHIESRHALSVEEIVRNPREFADALEMIFGVGARVIEESILKNVYRDLGLSYEEDKDFDFAECLREALAKGMV